MGEHVCRIETCTETFDGIGRLFYHESVHNQPIPEGDIRNGRYADHARRIALIRDDRRCQLPTCDRHNNGELDPSNAVKYVDAHHWEKRNHPDYITLFCREHHLKLVETGYICQDNFWNPLSRDGMIVNDRKYLPPRS